LKGGNGQIYHRWYDPNNSPTGWSTVAGRPNEPYWEPLGAPPGGADGSPAAATWGTNRLDVFVVAQNDDINIWHKFFQDTRWSNWMPHRPQPQPPSISFLKVWSFKPKELSYHVRQQKHNLHLLLSAALDLTLKSIYTSIK
jgi:hypothetical protein